MVLIGIFKKIIYDLGADRIGPDIPFTHWKLHFPSLKMKLCNQKFQKFSSTADFRPGAYAIGCSQIEIGERVIIRPGTMLFGETVQEMDVSITIEDDVMIGCGVHIYVNNHKFDQMDTPLIDQGYYPDEPVILKRGCWIGANVIILPGVTIGENAVVGAGAIVTKSISKGAVAVGNPARIIRSIL
jgi:acetyltransferase-like isoleucine patch superfamily enzyme